MNLNLYNITKGLNEIVLGNLSVFYSFKMPVAYRRKKTLIVREMDPRHFNEIVVNHPYKQVDKEAFVKSLDKAFKKEVEILAGMKGGKANGKKERKPRKQGKPRVVVDLPNRNAEKGQSRNRLRK